MKKLGQLALSAFFVSAFAVTASALDAPNIHATVNPDTDGQYTISWDVVSGATAYEVWEWDSTGTRISIKKPWGESNTNQNYSHEETDTWSYKVRVIQWTGSTWLYGPWSAAVFQDVEYGGNPLAAPVIQAPAPADTDGTYTISWSKVENCTAYEVWEWDSTGTRISIKKPWGENSTNQSYTHTENDTWSYKVRTIVYESGTWLFGAWSDAVFQEVNSALAAPVMNQPVNPDTNGLYAISWNAVTGATAYEVWEYDDTGTRISITKPWGQSNTDQEYTNLVNGFRSYIVRTILSLPGGGWDYGSWGVKVTQHVEIASPGLSFSVAQENKLNEYGSAAVRYFTSKWSNNKKVGFGQASYGYGFKRTCTEFGFCTPTNRLTPGDGAHVNINEVTLRILSLAAADKMGWLEYLPAADRYNESWGQITQALTTLRDMQLLGNPAIFNDGLYYRGYNTTLYTYDCGESQQCRMDKSVSQLVNSAALYSSDDNALPYMNLLTLEGLVLDTNMSVTVGDQAAVLNLCQEIRENLNLRAFYWTNVQVEVIRDNAPVFITTNVVCHDIRATDFAPSLKWLPNGNTTDRGQAYWDRRGAEGVPILAALLVSDAITLGEFYGVADTLENKEVTWQSLDDGPIPIKQASFHGTKFAHGLRSLHGMPVTQDEFPNVSFFWDSTEPVFAAHMDFARHHGLQALGTVASDAQFRGYPVFEYYPTTEFSTETRGQSLFPGNERGVMPDPNLVTTSNALARATSPHAWFVSLSRYRDLLTQEDIDDLFAWMAAYEPNFFHSGTDVDLGWVATIPWTANDATFTWQDPWGDLVYTDGGNFYEALDAAYTILHIFDALNPNTPLSSYNVEHERLGHIGAFFDSGTPLPAGLFNP